MLDYSTRSPPVPDLLTPLQQWVREGKLERILRVLAEELHRRGQLDLEAFIEASFTLNMIGNGVATLVLARWEGELERQTLQRNLT